jgi:hypothetical protein
MARPPEIGPHQVDHYPGPRQARHMRTSTILPRALFGGLAVVAAFEPAAGDLPGGGLDRAGPAQRSERGDLGAQSETSLSGGSESAATTDLYPLSFHPTVPLRARS